jgi:hypothetical protein
MGDSVTTGIHSHLPEQVSIMQCSQGVPEPDGAPPPEMVKRPLSKLMQQHASVHRNRNPGNLLQVSEM